MSLVTDIAVTESAFSSPSVLRRTQVPEFDVVLFGAGGDLAARKLHADTLSVEAARALVTRLDDGRIGWTHLARAPNTAVLDARDARARPAREPATAPWAITLDALTLARSHLPLGAWRADR